MEMKEKHELLDEGDDGGDGVVGDGDGDEDGDGDDGATTSKRALKRKAQNKKKKTSVKKKQRKAVAVTRLDQKEDYTPGYTPTPHSGDRITELLEAVSALPDVLDAVVKREVSNLPGMLRSLVQEIQSSRGQSNQEVYLCIYVIYVLFKWIFVNTIEVHAIVRDQEVVDPSTEKVVGSSVLVSGDIRMGYNYVAEEDRSIRVRLRFAYCMSPFIDSTRASAKKLQQDKSKYDQFKRKAKPARYVIVNLSSVQLTFIFIHLLVFMKQHVDAYMSNLAKRQESDLDNYRYSLILLSSEFYDWIDYSYGNRPGWRQPWWLYTQSKDKINSSHAFQATNALRRLLPSIMNKYGFFSNRSEKPRGDVFTISVSSNQMIPQQSTEVDYERLEFFFTTGMDNKGFKG
ncbi:hypothetical protein Ddye_004705 [Dipteronia dyeriana]|uniref:Uncharacterized protein n=1 Tax=Dipteronia dyeriana TaxID=168575 RepID=A0AAD9XF89_9ROSI|nr:hypothetical protein Ddye_004705 [Dipteronia dyeriana]